MVRSNVTELRIRTLVLAGLFAVGLLATTGIQVLAGNSGATKGSGTWTKTGSMNTARDFHSATLLQSGEVLVAGHWYERPSHQRRVVRSRTRQMEGYGQHEPRSRWPFRNTCSTTVRSS